MSGDADIERIEQQVQRAAHEDGLLEICLGVYLLLLGALLAARLSLAWIAPLLAPPLWYALERAKRRYVYPRIGYVRFGPDKQADPMGIVGVTVALTLVCVACVAPFILVMGTVRGASFWLERFVPVFVGCLLGIGPYWFAQTFGQKRGYVAAALFPVSGIAIPALGIATGYAAIGFECVLVGLLSLVFGVIALARFLRRYSVQEASDGTN